MNGNWAKFFPSGEFSGKLAGNSPDGKWWENLHNFLVGNGEKWCFNGIFASYVNY